MIEHQRAYTDAVQRRTGCIVPWLFHREGRAIRSMDAAWRSSCTRVGAPGRIIHNFRRTAVRNLERAGVPRSVAMKLTGHKTEDVYRRYAIVASRDLSEQACLAPSNFGRSDCTASGQRGAGAHFRGRTMRRLTACSLMRHPSGRATPVIVCNRRR